MSQYKMRHYVGTMYREPLKRRLAMFTVKNTGENSGETYKLSSDVGAYIFVLLKCP